MLKWDEVYETGFVDIDDQHKQLFQVINRLGERIEAGEGEHIIGEVLDFLEEYVEMHFGYEEECMRKHKCPVTCKNKIAHAKFIEGYHAYRAHYGQNGASKELAEEIHDECERWLTNHICHVDIHLRACVPSLVN